VQKASLMAAENDFIERLRAMATHPGARGLLDDAALLEIGSARLVLTHDMLVEGVHFLPTDPPESVAWKLIAVNLSDLAAKGARPIGALMGYSLRGDAAWDERFAAGLRDALEHFDLSLLGGDTVTSPTRAIGLTMIGEAGAVMPSRSGARDGDALFVTGAIGDAGLGLRLATDGGTQPTLLLAAYQQPVPQLAAGRILAGVVTAMMDVSDGLLIDAARLADASGVAALIDLDAVPLSFDALAFGNGDRAARLEAATAGDDYQLLFTSALPLPPLPCTITRIGRMVQGSGIHLHDAMGAVPLPERLGWLHS
jgi:thiamine-monophosphate kinase